MRIAVRGGHTELCTGAVGLIKELTEDRLVVNELIQYLYDGGAEVYNVTPPVNYTSDQGTDLAYGVNKANELGVDLFVSIHFNNAYDNYNGAIGSEVCVNSEFDTAKRIVDGLGSLGFKNRGQKIRTGLYEIKYTSMKAVIVETCFVEATEDVRIYQSVGYRGVAKAIAEAILNTKIDDITTPDIPAETPVVSDVDRAREFVGVKCLELQQKLIKLGYNCGGYGADGKFGQGTLKSLYEFQRDHCSMVDGLAGNEVFTKLDQLIKAQSNVGVNGGYEQHGNATVLVDKLNVRTAPSLSASSVATYVKGQTIYNYDRVYDVDGYRWIRYMGGSGNYRYIAVRDLSTSKKLANCY